MALVLGVDLSTQSVTIEARDADRFTVQAQAREPLPPTCPPVSEQHPDDWWQAVVAAAHAISAQVDLGRVRAVAVGGQCHGLVPLGADLRPLRAAKLWNDTTSAPELAQLLERVPPARFVRRTGSRPTPAFTVAKLAWLVVHEPQTVARVRALLLPHDYLNLRLTGQLVTDRSEASGTGYFDSVSNRYDLDLLTDCFGDRLDWHAVLPEVRGPDAAAGTVTADAAAALGLPAGTPVAVGGGDQHLAALGLGVAETDLVVSLGTSGVVLSRSSRPVVDERGWVNGVADATGGWLPLVCTLNCTKVTDWAARLLGVGIAELDTLARAGSTGPTPVFATYLDGERSPSLPGATGTLTGLTGQTSREALAAAAFEGVTMGLLRGCDQMLAAGVHLDGSVLLVGGGARSVTYPALVAGMLRRPVAVLDEPEATVRGACVQARALLDQAEVGEVAQRLRPRAARTVDPDPQIRSWSERRDRYLALCQTAASLASA